MSVEAPIPPVGKPANERGSSRAIAFRFFLFVLLTLVLTVATVWGARIWLKNSETLVFAVGDPNGPEARFAGKLAAMLKNNFSRLKVKIVTNADNAKALAQFDRQEANLTVLRTDAKVPARARAVAILDHDLVLVLSPGGKKIKSAAELKKKKVAVIADNESSAAFIRNVLELADSPATAPLVQVVPPGSAVDKLFASGFAAVIAIAPASKIMKDKSYEQFAERGGLTAERDRGGQAADPQVSGAVGGDASRPARCPPRRRSRRMMSIRSGCNGCWSRSPGCRPSPSANSRASIYENKAELALENGFASRIEPAATDKDAFIIAHPGAAEYINDDIKSFVERYSDLMYFARRRAWHHRLDLRHALYQGDADRAGEGERARDRSCWTSARTVRTQRASTISTACKTSSKRYCAAW